MASRDEWRIDKHGQPIKLSRLELALYDGRLRGESALAAGRWLAAKQHGREQAQQSAEEAENVADDQAADRLERQRLELQATEWANQRDYERWLFDQLDAKPDPPRAPFPF